METTVEETLKQVTLSRRPGEPARLQWTSFMEDALLELQALLGSGQLREVIPNKQFREGYFLLEVELSQVPEALRALLPARCRVAAS